MVYNGMKQQDWAVIVVIIFISGIISFIISGKIISPGHHQQEVEMVPAINSNFNNQAVSQYFTSQSTDPVQNTQIGPNSNTQPFTSGDQNQ